MNKKAISVTLSPDNLLWLRGRTAASKKRSVSETLDNLIHELRASSGQAGAQQRSVVGMVTIQPADGGFRKADREIRQTFEESLSRPISVPPASRKRRKSKTN